MQPPTHAPLWLRLAALGYDLLVLVAVWMLVAALVLLAFDGEVDVAHQPPLYHAVLQLTLLLVTAAYFTLSWARAGQTIGMRAWRLHLVDASGQRAPSMRTSSVNVSGSLTMPACELRNPNVTRRSGLMSPL